MAEARWSVWFRVILAGQVILAGALATTCTGTILGESRHWELEATSYAAAGLFEGASQLVLLGDRRLAVAYLGGASEGGGQEVVFAELTPAQGVVRREVIGGAAMSAPAILAADETVLVAYLVKSGAEVSSGRRAKPLQLVVARTGEAGEWLLRKVDGLFLTARKPLFQRATTGDLYLILEGRGVGDAKVSLTVWKSRDIGQTWTSVTLAKQTGRNVREPVWLPLAGPGLAWIEESSGEYSVVWAPLGVDEAKRRELYTGRGNPVDLRAASHGDAALVAWRSPALRRFRVEAVATTDAGRNWRHLVVTDERATEGNFEVVRTGDSLAVVWRTMFGPRHRPLQTVWERRLDVADGTISSPRKCREWKEPASSFVVAPWRETGGWLVGMLRELGPSTAPMIFDDTGRELRIPDLGNGIVAGRGLGLLTEGVCVWWIARGADPYAPNPSLQAMRGSIHVGMICNEDRSSSARFPGRRVRTPANPSPTTVGASSHD